MLVGTIVSARRSCHKMTCPDGYSRSPDKGWLLKHPPDSWIWSPSWTSDGIGAETWAGLIATVFPEFIARDGQGARPYAVKESSAGLVRPIGAAEDTALRALTAYGRGLQSRTM